MEDLTQTSGSATSHRIPAIDALRGLAVILMVQQHLGAWLWHSYGFSFSELFHTYPIFMSLNWLGNLAAPIFVILAGMGSELLSTKLKNPNPVLVRRGLVIMIFGYILNFMVPHWLSPGAWYILHLIGLCLIISPLLLKMNSRVLYLLIGVIIILTPILQTYLQTPLYLPTVRMSDTSMPGGPLRLAIAEGLFPIFPWSFLFLSGILTFRLMRSRSLLKICFIGICYILFGTILGLLHFRGYPFATYGIFYRFFLPLPYFFPALPPLMMMLTGITLILLGLFLQCYPFKKGLVHDILVNSGRTSLTILIIHVFTFNELSRHVKIYRNLSLLETTLLILFFIVIIVIITSLWRKKAYKYGCEWVMRKIAG